jgi:CubicO group peptidase (beta-lactamase class C family)
MTTATRDNWRTHPHSVWAFQNLERLLPTARVAAPAAARPLAVEPLDLSDLRIADPDGGAMDWETFLAVTHADAIAVAHRGRLVVERYRNGMTPATRHMLFSITKSVAGLVAERLAAAGALDPSARAAELVPDLAGSAFGDATLRALLDMRDGVPFDENYADPDADIHRYSRGYWGPDGEGVRAKLAALPAGPGRDRFAYRTPVADVVGWVLERATGRRFADLVASHVWGPMGAEHDARLVLDNAGDSIAGSGLNATLRDVVRLGLHLLEHRDDPAVAAIRAGGCRDAFAAAAPPTRRGWSYRSFWWLAHDAAASFGAFGVFGQRLYVRPGTDTVIVRFGSHPTAANTPTDALHWSAFDALAQRLESRFSKAPGAVSPGRDSASAKN